MDTDYYRYCAPGLKQCIIYGTGQHSVVLYLYFVWLYPNPSLLLATLHGGNLRRTSSNLAGVACDARDTKTVSTVNPGRGLLWEIDKAYVGVVVVHNCTCRHHLLQLLTVANSGCNGGITPCSQQVAYGTQDAQTRIYLLTIGE